MAGATVRVDEETRQRINRLGAARGQSAGELLADLVSSAEDDALLAGMDGDFAAMRAEPERSATYDQDTGLWAGTLLDGLGRRR